MPRPKAMSGSTCERRRPNPRLRAIIITANMGMANMYLRKSTLYASMPAFISGIANNGLVP